MNSATVTVGPEAKFLPRNQNWAQFTLDSGTEYHISTHAQNPTKILFVCGPDLLQIADTSADTGTGMMGESALLNFTPSATGLHYVKIDGGTGPTADYGKLVRVSDLSNELCSEDSFTTCTATVGNAGLEGTIDSHLDYDWVKVQLMNGKSYQIDVRSNGHPGIDPSIMDIYDKRGNQITRPVDFGHSVFTGFGDYDSGHGNAARVIYTATEGGNHFIKIAGRGSWQERPGHWHVQVTEASAPFYDDYAADTSTTGTVSVGGTVSGWIDATPTWYDAGDTGGPNFNGREPGYTADYLTGTSCYEVAGDGIELDGDTCDRDWFAVDLTNNRSYKLQLGEFYRMIVGVYNSSGVRISGGSDDFVVFDASYTGKHYIAVTGDSTCSAVHGCTGRYTLRVTQR